MSQGIYIYSENRVDRQIKVGKAEEHESRVKNLQTGNPSKLLLEYSGDFSEPVERQFQKAFNNFRSTMGGGKEWYFYDILPAAISWFENHKYKISPDFEEEVEDQDDFTGNSRMIKLDEYFDEGRIFYGNGGVKCVYINNNMVQSDDGDFKYSTVAKKHTGYEVAGADFWRLEPNGETIRKYINNKEKI